MLKHDATEDMEEYKEVFEEVNEKTEEHLKNKGIKKG